MVVGAVAVMVAATAQEFIQGDNPSFIKIGVYLVAGALIGLGVNWFLDRRTSR